jgi:hypothetical protein
MVMVDGYGRGSRIALLGIIRNLAWKDMGERAKGVALMGDFSLLHNVYILFGTTTNTKYERYRRVRIEKSLSSPKLMTLFRGHYIFLEVCSVK